MTSLEDFIKGKKKVTEYTKTMEPASGSFMCQNTECNEIVFEGYVDRSHNKLKWVCSNNHESAVSI